MAFILWGPLVDPTERLLLFETGDAKKNNEALSRGAKRKLELEEKEVERSSDTNHIRGFNTDQRINIESLIAQQKMQKQQERESSMVALIATERALSRQIDIAEKRALMRCPECDPNNSFWLKVDELISEQETVTTSMQNFSKSLTNEFKENEKSIVAELHDSIDESRVVENSTMQESKDKSKKIVLDDSSPEKSIKNTKGMFVDVDESSSSEDHDGE